MWHLANGFTLWERTEENNYPSQNSPSYISKITYSTYIMLIVFMFPGLTIGVFLRLLWNIPWCYPCLAHISTVILVRLGGCVASDVTSSHNLITTPWPSNSYSLSDLLSVMSKLYMPECFIDRCIYWAWVSIFCILIHCGSLQWYSSVRKRRFFLTIHEDYT